MSDPTRPLPRRPSQGRSPGSSRRWRGPDRGVLVIALFLLAVIFVAFAFLRFSDGGDPVIAPPGTESPTPTEPTGEPTPTAPTSTPEPTESPTEEPTDAAEPTDADAAAFASSYQPQGARSVDFVAVDITADERKEIVFASIVGDRSRIDIAAWDGQRYGIVYTGEGGSADVVDRFMVRDFTGNGFREVVTVQSVGGRGQSLSIWGYDGTSYAPQRARGGCWDGSHTYGVTGADISEGQIVATCDASPLPTAAWPSDVYVWDGETWAYERTQAPG